MFLSLFSGFDSAAVYQKISCASAPIHRSAWLLVSFCLMQKKDAHGSGPLFPEMLPKALPPPKKKPGSFTCAGCVRLGLGNASEAASMKDDMALVEDLLRVFFEVSLEEELRIIGTEDNRWDWLFRSGKFLYYR